MKPIPRVFNTVTKHQATRHDAVQQLIKHVSFIH